ncbi:MAG: acyl dehydratase [Dehalococcoidales bacterium]|nr:acyl dehydratase [Dehalococcoidales bacterium]
MAQVKMITTLDEFEAERKKGIGMVWPWDGRWRRASLDNIYLFADGIGDFNPLYRDEEYAKKSRFNTVIAPPTFGFGLSIGSTVADTGNIDPARLSTKDFPMNYAGAEMEFIRPIWLGDKIRVIQTVGNIYRKESRRLGPICFCEGLNSYYNQRHELVTTLKILMARYHNVGRGMEYDREAKAGAVAEPADPLVWERTRRGADPRYWEDVKEGDELATLKKGTYTVSELYHWSFFVSQERRSTRAHLEEEGSADLSGGGRVDTEHALKRRNMPGTFDIGPQRVCWLAQSVTDWMGDDATLKKIQISIRHPNVVGDTNTVRGKVVKKYIKDGEHLVDVEVGNENQAGLATASGFSTVALPSKSKPAGLVSEPGKAGAEEIV